MRRHRGKDRIGFRHRIPQIVDEQHAAVRLLIAMNQSTNVMILGEEYPVGGGSFGEQRVVARVD